MGIRFEESGPVCRGKRGGGGEGVIKQKVLRFRSDKKKRSQGKKILVFLTHNARRLRLLCSPGLGRERPSLGPLTTHGSTSLPIKSSSQMLGMTTRKHEAGFQQQPTSPGRHTVNSLAPSPNSHDSRSLLRASTAAQREAGGPQPRPSGRGRKVSNPRIAACQSGCSPGPERWPPPENEHKDRGVVGAENVAEVLANYVLVHFGRCRVLWSMLSWFAWTVQS